MGVPKAVVAPAGASPDTAGVFRRDPAAGQLGVRTFE
jgi:hypothetical protein